MTVEAPAIDSRAAFVAAVKWGFEAAAAQGARRIVCCDPGFADWPLDDAGLLQGLAAWLRLPQRRLVLLARNYDEMPRRWPRFVAWRRDWAHAIEAWQPPADLGTELPTLLVADRAISVVLADAVHWRGRAAVDEREAQSWRERIDAVLQRSEPGFAVYTLGL
jgi:hypothetical protein